MVTGVYVLPVLTLSAFATTDVNSKIGAPRSTEPEANASFWVASSASRV